MSSIEERLANLRKKKQEMEERKKQQQHTGMQEESQASGVLSSSQLEPTSSGAVVTISSAGMSSVGSGSGFTVTAGAATGTSAGAAATSTKTTTGPRVTSAKPSPSLRPMASAVRSLQPKYRDGPAKRYTSADLLGELQISVCRAKRSRDESGPSTAGGSSHSWGFLTASQSSVSKVDLGAEFHKMRNCTTKSDSKDSSTRTDLKRAPVSSTTSALPQQKKSPTGIDQVDSTTSALTGLARYKKGKAISEGVYGQVFSGIDLKTDTVRALKLIKASWFEQSQIGFPPYLMREFDILLRLDHPNIVKAHELVMGTEVVEPQQTEAKTEQADRPMPAGAPPLPPLASIPPPSAQLPVVNNKVVLLVMDHCIVDLKNFVSDPQSHPGCLKTGAARLEQLRSVSQERSIPQLVSNIFSRKISRVKCIMKQLLSGLQFLHEHNIVHRDLKSSNILIDAKGGVKVCDFGLARVFQDGAYLSPNVVTLMYRAPELHFGIRDYNASIDIWAAGCIFFECLRGRPLFVGMDTASHFKSLCSVLGDPTESDFHGLHAMPEAVKLLHTLPFQMERRKNQIRTSADYLGQGFSPLLDDTGYDFLTKMVAWNPMNRWTAEQLLKHPYLAGSGGEGEVEGGEGSVKFIPPCSPAELLISLLDKRYAEEDGLLEATTQSPQRVPPTHTTTAPGEQDDVPEPAERNVVEESTLLGHESRTPEQHQEGEAGAVGNLEDTDDDVGDAAPGGLLPAAVTSNADNGGDSGWGPPRQTVVAATDSSVTPEPNE